MLGLQATEEQIKEFFVSCGGVKDVRLLRDRATSRPRVGPFALEAENSINCPKRCFWFLFGMR